MKIHTQNVSNDLRTPKKNDATRHPPKPRTGFDANGLVNKIAIQGTPQMAVPVDRSRKLELIETESSR